MAKKTKAQLAQEALAAKYKANPPTGTYIGSEKNKGLLPKGYKGPEKGKYYGPDKYKGRVDLYNAAQRKAANPTAPAAPAAPASAGEAPAPEAPVDPMAPESAYDPNATVSNGSGTISLQTTHDLNMQELDAEDEARQAELAADQEEQASIIEETNSNNALQEQRRKDRGSTNANLAYRGMTRGSTATQKLTEMTNKHSTSAAQIAAQRKLAKDSALAKRTAAKTTLAERKRKITLARQGYTTDQSATSPTAGSSAVDSGVNPVVVG